MASIIETLAGDRRLELKNEEVVRKMAFADKWNQVTVGCRVGINGVANITGSPELIIGVCAGNKAYKGTVTAMIGKAWPTTTTAAYNAGPPAYFSPGNTNVYGISKVGASTTKTLITNGTVTTYVASTAAGLSHIFAATFTRTAGGIIFTRQTDPISVANAQAGNNFDEFIRNMDNELGTGPAVIKGSTLGCTFQLLNTSVFDSAFIYWSHNFPSVEISDWLVIRHS